MTQLNEAFSAVWRDIGNLLRRVERLETQEGPRRTRRIPLVPLWDRRTGAFPVMAVDSHGSLSVPTLHIDETENNASYKLINYQEVVLPVDYVAGTVALKWLALSDAVGNNYVWNVIARDMAAGAWTELYNGAVVVAASTTANSLSLHSVDLSVNPTAGRSFTVEIGMASNHASDTSTGNRSLYSAWLEYTAVL